MIVTKKEWGNYYNYSTFHIKHIGNHYEFVDYYRPDLRWWAMFPIIILFIALPMVVFDLIKPAISVWNQEVYKVIEVSLATLTFIGVGSLILYILLDLMIGYRLISNLTSYLFRRKHLFYFIEVTKDYKEDKNIPVKDGLEIEKLKSFLKLP